MNLKRSPVSQLSSGKETSTTKAWIGGNFAAFTSIRTKQAREDGIKLTRVQIIKEWRELDPVEKKKFRFSSREVSDKGKPATSVPATTTKKALRSTSVSKKPKLKPLNKKPSPRNRNTSDYLHHDVSHQSTSALNGTHDNHHHNRPHHYDMFLAKIKTDTDRIHRLLKWAYSNEEYPHPIV